ncbi:hypothetical protein [Acidovorax sp.]|uniref:hypothetical protein n=1 Tax=Acidovorax sp. TaxID=1872122 RepID=UPI002ACE0A93|nr:hypothetical protein [Acidovorax sp.]MDZ7862636.1 hypothetical protein [Acidovorax sp.]
MTNDHIQKWLAQVGSAYAVIPLVSEAAEIIRFLAGPDGALQIADQAAAELILSECYCQVDGGIHYWQVAPAQAVMALDDEDAETARALGSAVRYLASRGLLAAHPTNALLVRPLLPDWG